MIYLFIYFVVVFFTFSYFGIKELIRDSQRLQLCNFVRPSENVQDNTSNWEKTIDSWER